MAALRFCGGDARARKDLAGVAVLFKRNREQQPLDGDVAVAGLLGDLLGVVEQPRGGLRQIDLAGPAARDLRQLAERFLDAAQRLARIAAGAVDQTGGQTLRVVKQDLQDVLGRELLMALAQRPEIARTE